MIRRWSGNTAWVLVVIAGLSMTGVPEPEQPE